MIMCFLETTKTGYEPVSIEDLKKFESLER